MEQTDQIISFIRKAFHSNDGNIPLHAPTFGGNEKKYLLETIDSTFVSSVGKYVDLFEESLAAYTGAKYAIACVNGTNALHVALLIGGVEPGDEVLTQALTFVATANAITYSNATPVFIDVDKDTLGMSPEALNRFLAENCERKSDGYTYNNKTNKRISACVPMHTFGLPTRIKELANICHQWNISLIEDAAESLGSYYDGIHTGNFGIIGTFSFNGNKTITAGGGGALITNDEAIAKRLKHITTQAKQPHPWSFIHDEIGYNYRMPNVNAAIACAQLEQLDSFLEKKRKLAISYQLFFATFNTITFVKEIDNTRANYWLNTICFETKEAQQNFLRKTNESGVMTRPAWDLMSTLPMFVHCQNDGLENSKWLVDRLVNIPSSVT